MDIGYVIESAADCQLKFPAAYEAALTAVAPQIDPTGRGSAKRWW